LVVLASCSIGEKAPEIPNRYQLKGEVVRLDKANQVATLKHETISDNHGGVWMDAMTMEFPVQNSQEFSRLFIGARITAQVVQLPSSYDYWIENIEKQVP
jgi:Cu/Ag efflux protein CusF